MQNRLRQFDSVFIKLFVSVMLALILFACAMVMLTHLVHDTSTNTRHQIIANQVGQQLEPVLLQLQQAQQNQQNLETRYLLALVRRSFNVYSESLNARFGLYDAKTRQAIMVAKGLPDMLPPEPTWYHSLLPTNDDPKRPTEVQIPSQAGYVILYHSNINQKPPISPAINLITGTLLLLLIMSAMLWFITRTMTWRINQMSRQIKQLGDGDFSVRVTPVGNDEIAILAKGFNQTAERIETLMNANKLLLAHASHEIRTPITRIRLQVEMMSMLASQLGEKGQEKFAKRADAVNRDLTGLNDLVESILLVSRMDAGHAVEKMADVNLYELIKNEVQHYPKASFYGAKLHIEGQEKLLTHLIRNLLDNAHLHGVPPVTVQLYAIDELGNEIDLPIMNFQASINENTETTDISTIETINDNQPISDNTNVEMTENKTATEPPQTEKPILINKSTLFSRKKVDKNNHQIATTPHYQRIRIAVIDHGTGIAIDKRQDIFSPFVRLQQEKKGSGLGLSLVAQIVTAHHGTIITDTLNGQTRFLITLPIKQH